MGAPQYKGVLVRPRAGVEEGVPLQPWFKGRIFTLRTVSLTLDKSSYRLGTHVNLGAGPRPHNDPTVQPKTPNTPKPQGSQDCTEVPAA